MTGASISGNLETQEREQQAGATQGNELPPKIGKEVPPQGEEGRSEAGPGPSTLAHRSRGFQEAVAAIADDATHEELFLKNFLESHHRHMRAHIEKERTQHAECIQQAEHAAELEARPVEKAFTSPRPAPQPSLARARPSDTDNVPLESNPEYRQAKAQFRTADDDIKSMIDLLIREKDGMDHTDPAYRFALEKWQKAYAKLEALEAKEKIVQVMK